MTSLFLLAGLLTGFISETPTPPGPGTPPVLTIKAARALAPGSTVTIRAVVINGVEMSNIRYVQDADAGLALYAQPAKMPGFGELRAGDSIQVTGQLQVYNGLTEMDPIASFHKLASGVRALQVPVERVTEAFVEANECRLLEIKSVTRLTTPAGTVATTLAGTCSTARPGASSALCRPAPAPRAWLMPRYPPTSPSMCAAC